MGYAPTPAEVKKLRDLTGAGMLDCKKALVEGNGSLEEAQKVLKKRGLAMAEKRSGRSTSEGGMFVSTNGAVTALVELNCETDFVAKTSTFTSIGAELAKKFAGSESLAQDDPEVAGYIKEQVAVLKENMGIGFVARAKAEPNEKVFSYVHGAKIGVLIRLSSSDPALLTNGEFAELGSDLAMHAAAFAPQALREQDIPESFVSEQKEIIAAQMKGVDKPQNILDNMMNGKLKKVFSQVCMLDQGFVKDDKKSVKQVLLEFGKAHGGATIEISQMVYRQLGSGK